MSQIATVLRLMALWAVFSFTLAAQPIQITSVPTGFKPLGLTSMGYANPYLFDFGNQPLLHRTDYLVVANSGDNSVSVFSYNIYDQNLPPQPITVIRGIPDPHAVIPHCGDQTNAGSDPSRPFRFVVTSPSDNSVSVVTVTFTVSASVASLNASITRIPVGRQPVSAACFLSNGKSIIAVSNYADQSVTLIDGAGSTATATVPGIPGNSGLHGIGGPAQGSVAWIAGTDSNVLTLLDVNAAQVLSQISVQQPRAIQGTQVDTAAGVLSFDPATLQPTTVFAAAGVQLFESATFGTFVTTADGATTSLNLVSSGNLYPIPQASNPQDMMVRRRASCTITSRQCTYPDAQLIVTSRDSNSLIVIPPPNGPPHDFDLFNAASFAIQSAPSAAPGSLATIFVPTGASQAFMAETLPLPNTLGRVMLRIGGSFQLTPSAWVYSAVNSVQTPLLYVDATQINFQVPPGIAPGSIPLQLQRADGTTLLTTVAIGVTAPGIFSVAVNGKMQAAVLNQDNTLNSPDLPAARGTVIQIFATGGGDTTPMLVPGEAAPANGDPLVTTKTQPVVYISRTGNLPPVSAPVIFSGLAPGLVGVWQINAVIPQEAIPGTAVPLEVWGADDFSGYVMIAIE